MSAWQANRVFNSGDDFVKWLATAYPSTVRNNITQVHMHHTWSPNHSNKQSTLQLAKNMRNYHMNHNHWADIAQHITIGADGKIVLGRSITRQPASATGYNGSNSRHPFMFETIGNFDVGHDKLEGAQLASVLAVLHFFHVNHGKPIHFHREMSTKTCPGSGLNKAKITAQAKAYKPGRTPESVTETKPTHKPENTNPITVNSNSIVDYLHATGHKDASFAYRKKLAQEKGITNYKGTEDQNIKLLNILREEKAPHTEPVGKPASPSKLDIDGYLGAETIRKMQEALGTMVDGKLSKPSLMVKELQRRLGAKVDGHLGTETISLWQKYVGTPVDGKLSSPSLMIKATQKLLNDGKFKPTPQKESKAPSKNKLEVDGYWGKELNKELQRYFGTTVDGVISKQHHNSITNVIEKDAITFGNTGSLVVKKLQALLGVTQDGNLGPNTIKHLQKRLGTPVDGRLSVPSLMVKALQKALNKGKL